MDQFITLLSVGKPYDIPGENGAPNITGCTLWYIPSKDLSSYEDTDTGTLGFTPVKERMGVDFYQIAQAHGLPAVAKVTFGQKNSNGSIKLYIKGLEFVDDKKSSK